MKLGWFAPCFVAVGYRSVVKCTLCSGEMYVMEVTGILCIMWLFYVFIAGTL
jgi:hypothetical protein